MERKYTVYRTTNQLNGKIYIGCHQTNNIDDGYLGSGTVLIKAIEKYGRDNFSKEIVEVFNTSTEMFDFERKIVDDEFVQRSDTYNLKTGGYGGWNSINNGSAEHISRCQRNGRNRANAISKMSKSAKRKMFTNRFSGKNTLFKGKHHTEESKRKIGLANSLHQQGNNNSHFGRVWCVLFDDSDCLARKSFHKDNIPTGYITTSEWKDRRKKKMSTYGRSWYNNGKDNRLLLPDDVLLLDNKFRKGRFKNDVNTDENST